MTGSYCSSCGQRKQSRFTISYIVDEIFSILEFDKGILFNLKTLLLHPGVAVRDYLHGKTKPFYPPLSFFLLGMTLFILLILNLLEADGWSTGKVFIFDTYQNAKQINEYFQREQQWIVKQEIPDTTKIQQLMALETERTISIAKMESKAMRTQGITYVAFYLLPLYLTGIYLLLCYQSSLHFTEHLIIHTFGTAQILWISSLLSGIYYLFVFASIQIPSVIGLAGMGMYGLAVVGYYCQLIREAYQLSWLGAILRVLITGIILLILVFGFIFLVNFLTTGETHL